MLKAEKNIRCIDQAAGNLARKFTSLPSTNAKRSDTTLNQTHSSFHRPRSHPTSIMTNTPNADNAMATTEPLRSDVTVVDDGDIILALPEKHYIRVSSVVLSYTSPVFKAMLGPHFKEGKVRRSSDAPKEIALPEDDPIAMKHLCHLLHGQHTDSYDHGDNGFPERLLALAMLTDKYDCGDAIMLPLEAILSRFVTNGTAPELPFEQMAALTAAAGCLGLARYFFVFTKCLVLDYTDRFSSLAIDKYARSALTAEVLRKSHGHQVYGCG